MSEKQERDTGSTEDGASAVSASPATAARSQPSRQKGGHASTQTSPVEVLEIIYSVFQQLESAGIPAAMFTSKDGQIISLRFAAKQCPGCKQLRPLWYMGKKYCKECERGEEVSGLA